MMGQLRPVETVLDFSTLSTCYVRFNCQVCPESVVPNSYSEYEMKRFLLLTSSAFFAGRASASTLTTPSFVIQIEVRCAEGNVTCDNVTYVGTNRKSGKSIMLRGKTKHAMCADGVTPCQFQGYEFKNGTTYYRVLEDGNLLVMQGKKILVEEKGTWDW